MQLCQSLTLKYFPTLDHGNYQSLPQDDASTIGSLPYRPAVKLKNPPIPTMSFHMATELSDPKTTGSRYPFVPHQPSIPVITDQKPPRRGRRKSGQKQEPLAPSSAEIAPEIEALKQREKGRKASVVNLGGSGLPGWEYKPHMYVVPPGKTSVEHSGEGEVRKEPEIFLRLLYNRDTTSLVVKIEKVIDLPLRDDGSEVDAYVRLFFIPKLPELPQRRTSKTRTARRDSAPVFDEEIRYEAMTAEEMINSTLHVQVPITSFSFLHVKKLNATGLRGVEKAAECIKRIPC